MVDPEVVLLFGVLMNDFLWQEFSPWQFRHESEKKGEGVYGRCVGINLARGDGRRVVV
jgi:hypothetical protein